MKDRIFCLIGPSGSGKTSLAQELEKRGYNVIHSYTTRPQRSEDEWGHTFVDNYPPEDVPQTIAYNEFNGYEYWATKSQYQGKGSSIYVIDPAGAEMMRNTPEIDMVTIFLAVSSKECFKRMLNDRSFTHTIERLAHDEDIFGCVKTDWVIDANKPFQDVVKDVVSVINNLNQKDVCIQCEEDHQ